MIRASAAIRTFLLCSIGAALLYSRKYDEAIEQYKKTMHMDRNIKMVRLDLASAYEQEKMYPEAIAQWQGVIALGGGCWRNLSKLRLPGLPAELARPPSKGSACRRAALQDAKLLTLLGRKNEAVSSFEKAFMAREGQMIYLKCDRVLVPLRSDPGFQALVKKMNFPE